MLSTLTDSAEARQETAPITCKIARHTNGHRTTLRLIGHLRAACLEALQTQIEGNGPRTVLDLDEVTLVDVEAVRFSSSDSLEQYVSGAGRQRTGVSRRAALEESFFLGLRLTRGISLGELSAKFGNGVLEDASTAISQFVGDGLMERCGELVRLTARGRLLSNEVFERFILAEKIAG